MKRITSIFLFLIPMAVFLISSCHNSAKPGEQADQNFCIPDSLMANITFDTVKSEPVVSALALSGKISFNEDNVVKIYPLVSGHVGDVKVSLGDYVQKGQLLAVVRSSDMAGYFNEYQSAKSELAISKKNLEVTKEMKNSGVSSEKDYLTAQSEYQKALAQYNKVNEVMRIYGNTPQANDSIGSGYAIKSPISGFIVEKNVTAGTELRADAGNQLFTISDLKDVWAIANVYETDISKIKTGSEVEVSTLSYPDKKFIGKVERISNILNPETNVMTVKIRLTNADYTLKPGMFANISVLFPAKEKSLVVPAKTILYDGSKSYVVWFHKRCDVDMQPVIIRKSYNDKTYIEVDSVREGDLVIERNNLFVFTALKKL